jgi:hypothetical protein
LNGLGVAPATPGCGKVGFGAPEVGADVGEEVGLFVDGVVDEGVEGF